MFVCQLSVLFPVFTWAYICRVIVCAVYFVFYVNVQCWVCKMMSLITCFLHFVYLSMASPKLLSHVFAVVVSGSVCVFILFFVSLSFSRVSQCHQQTVSPLRNARAHQEVTPPHKEELRQRGGAVMTKSPLPHTPMYVFLCVLVLIGWDKLNLSWVVAAAHVEKKKKKM